MENTFAKIIILALNLTIISAQCSTIVTPGGTQSPENCKFPFWFKGRQFLSCTSLYDGDNQEWCSVQTDDRGHHVQGQGRWGHCDKKLCSSSNTSSVVSSIPKSVTSKAAEEEQCLTIGGRFPGKPCIFPFKMGSNIYRVCTTDVTDDNIPWCSTKVTEDGRHVGGHWGHCPCQNGICCQLTQNITNGNRNERRYPDSPVLSRNINAPNFLPEVPNDCAFIGIESKVVGRDITKSFVVAGQKASLYEFPYAVMIGYNTSSGITYGCGGSLINRWYVLSAAHCFGLKLPDAVEVRVGELNVEEDPDCEDNECAPRVQKIKVDTITVHEGFSATIAGIPNDIALVRLATPAIIGPSVRPVCLPINLDKILNETVDKDLDVKKSLVGQTVIVVGWGQISYNNKGQIRELGVSQPHLQQAKLAVTLNRNCVVNDTIQICAVHPHRDSCKGDSGGPLILHGKGNERIQIGIVSYGPRNCGNGLPGVYTRVSAYINWIKTNLNP